MSDWTTQDISGALAGDASALGRVVDHLMPVVHARVTRVLYRYAGSARGRDIRQEADDMVQEVFLALFDKDGKVLRSWDPARGMSLANFVGLVAQRTALQVMRSGRRNPWTEDPTLAETLDVEPARDAPADRRVGARQAFDVLLDRLGERLSPLGMSLFQELLVRQRGVVEVAEARGMSTAAVYAWQGRLKKLVRGLASEVEG